MSSDNKKIFTTQAASKGAGADVTSDVISLPDAVSDAILSVKTDASCTGVVDVKLEMSPDGTNWCPAVTRTVSANVVNVEPKIGNEEYVKLTPDAGEFKNKHARGGLNFDVNGAVVTPDGSGARDLMDQHIAVNKSFNYSQWFKTSEAPTTTYKPVLFRHGGYDNFENTKTVALTDAATQNLCEPKSTYTTVYNGIGMSNSAVGNAGARFYIEPNSDAATFYGFSGVSSSTVESTTELENGKLLLGMWSPSQAFSTSRWWWAQTASNVSTNFRAGWKSRGILRSGYPHVNYHVANSYQRFSGYLELGSMITYSTNDAAVKTLDVSPYISQQSTGLWYVYNSNPVITFTKKSDNTTFDVNILSGFHHVVTYTPPADFTQGIPEANVACYINGVQVKINVTTENNVDYVIGAAPSDNLFNGDESYGATNANWTGVQAFTYGTTYRVTTFINNHMDFQRQLSASEAVKLYNGGKLLDFSNMQTSFPISLSNCVGAYDSDVTFIDWGGNYNVVIGLEDCSGFGKHIRTSLNNSTASTQYTASVPVSLSFMATPSLVLNNAFSSSSDLSISGWFKTTSTGTLFSNTGGAAATGLKVDVSGSAITASYLSSSLSTSVTGTFNDGNWHHIAMVLSSGSQLIVVDNLTSGTSNHTLVDADLKGDNGFTLLGDGQNNAHAASPGATDASKLLATLSNWSVHSEALDDYAINQLYSNGHVRNVKNLPNINANSIEAWWQLNDPTTPEQDLSGNSRDAEYQDGNSPTETLVQQLVNADGPTLVEDTINGNAMTLSLTKSFNFTTKEWVNTADQDTALCLSFNGFEEQAEHIALWKCSQTVGGSVIDICDGGWHNVILSYRGNNDLAGNNVAEGDVVKFGPGPAQSLAHNWMMSFDGEPLKAINDGSGADHIDGLGPTITDTYNSVVYNVGFNIYNRHMKYETSNTEEEYKPHAQFSAGIHEVTGVDNINAFQGSVDETSFHSDCWWVDQAGTSIVANTFNQEKPATIYGSTTALTDRGAGTAYPVGVPYPLTSPGEIGASRGGNQWINPYRKGEVQEDTNTSIGGVEGWWRWGDTPGDCSVTINDVKDHDDSINARDISAFEIVTADRQDMSVNNESIYNEDIASGSATGNVAITFPQIVVAGIQAGICNLKQISSPLLKYLRVKFTGAGSCDLGSSSTQAQINFRSKE